MQKNNQKNINDNFPIVFATDDKYAPSLGVSIKSLILNSSDEKNYTIYILISSLNEYYKNSISKLETKNVKINFINITDFLNKYPKKTFYTCFHFSKAVYFRFFICDIFKNYNKILYCDCDSIFLKDISEIYEVDLEENYIGAVKDLGVFKEISYNKNNYFKDKLKLKNPTNYFNSGFLLMNLDKMRKNNFSQKCLETLKEIKKPKFPDQCVLNKVCENKVKFLNSAWNVINHLKIYYKNISEILPDDIYQEYENNLKYPNFLHFTGGIKPWHNFKSFNADIFFEYARKTQFYEELFYLSIKNQSITKKIIKKPINFLKKIKRKILK